MIVILPTVASATPLIIQSHAQASNTVNDAIVSPDGIVQEIGLNDAWYAMPGVPYVSTANTGKPSSAGFVELPNGTEITLHQSFSLAGSTVNSATINVLCDDTCGGSLNGHTLFVPFPTQGTNCAGGKPGCLLPTMLSLVIDPAFFNSGAINDFIGFFDQRALSSAGMAWRINADVSRTPEPATGGLVGLVGIVLLLSVHRRRTKSWPWRTAVNN